MEEKKDTHDTYMRHWLVKSSIILGANTLYSVFCFFKALLPKQVWSGMVGKGLTLYQPYLAMPV